IGQLLGDIPNNFDRLRCFATSLKWFQSSGFQASLGTAGIPGTIQISYPDLPANPDKFETAISDAISIFNSLYANGLTVNLPYIIENYIREELNSILGNIFTPANQNCDGTTPIHEYIYDDPCTSDSCVHIDFSNSNDFDVISAIINKVLGG